MTRPVRRAGRPALAALVLAAVAVLVAGGCSGDPDQPDEPAATASSPSEHAVQTRVTWGRITGRLTPQVRKRLAAQVGAVVDGWAEAAYLGGDYPRRTFSDAWPGFTPDAQREAHGDRALMSNEDIGDRIDGVTPRKRLVRIDVLAVRKHPVGVTAHVLLAFGTTGQVERHVRVRGRLFLTHTDRGWKVFGYDVTKGAV